MSFIMPYCYVIQCISKMEDIDYSPHRRKRQKGAGWRMGAGEVGMYMYSCIPCSDTKGGKGGRRHRVSLTLASISFF